MIPVKPDARRIILLEATIVTYLLILQDQRVEWEQQQKEENHFNQWCVPMCAARVDIVCNPRYSGEYIINYISLLIISILPSIWSYILKDGLHPIFACKTNKFEVSENFTIYPVLPGIPH